VEQGGGNEDVEIAALSRGDPLGETKDAQDVPEVVRRVVGEPGFDGGDEVFTQGGVHAVTLRDFRR
jgi:hypothetical protein